MRRDFSKIYLLTITMLLLFSSLSFGQAWSGIVDPARATNWANAGLPGGIPTITTICANVLTTDTTAQIQTKMNGCAAGQVVLFPAGSWTLTASLYANKGIVLRGAGPTQTTITLGSGTNIFFGVDGTGGLGGYPPNTGATNWTGGLTLGSTTLTVASSAGMAVGQHVVLDQLNNTSLVFPTGNEGASGSSGRNGLSFEGSYARAQFQMVEITAIPDSTHITVNPPVDYTHSASLTPQVFYWNTSGGGNIEYAGVENMQINANSQNFAIAFDWCSYSWVKNVVVTNVARDAVYMIYGYRNEVRDSYFAGPLTAGGPTQYGLEITNSSLVKVENNILYGITSAILPATSNGLVAGYNYAYNPVAGNEFVDFDTHQVHNYNHLYEGNVFDSEGFDNIWGSASQNTMFRNRISGDSPNKTNYRTVAVIASQNHYMNLVGNVLGTIGFHTVYQCDSSNVQSTDNFEYDLGFWSNCQVGDGSGNPYDATTESSLMRWGNWDAVTYTANGKTNGVRWCTGAGAGNPACTTSEVPTADPTFPNPVPSNQTLPASFYLTATPSWFGSVPFPAIGPDVTCTSNCVANTASHVAEIPAQLCYANGTKDSNGYLTAFDANVCYGSTTAVASPPSPPVGVSAVVN